jgi:hypothetical protein
VRYGHLSTIGEFLAKKCLSFLLRDINGRKVGQNALPSTSPLEIFLSSLVYIMTKVLNIYRPPGTPPSYFPPLQFALA